MPIRYDQLTLMGDQPRYWDLVDRMKFPALPIQHPFYEKEQEMRFAKGAPSVTQQATIRTLAVQPFENAKAAFRKARSLDPDYVDPIVWNAHIKWLPMIWGTTEVAPKEGFLQAKEGSPHGNA